MRIKLGDKYRDKVTGFEGVATASHKWLTGCDTVSIQPPVDKDGKVPDVQGFDVSRLERVKDDEPIPAIPKTGRNKGGPQDTPREGAHR